MSAAATTRDFSQQSPAKMSADDRRAWCKSAAKAAERHGARWHRYTYDEAKGVVLYEGWKSRPEIEGDPAFHLINGPSGGSH